MRPICSICKRRYFSRANDCEESSVTISGGYKLIIGAGKSMVTRPGLPLGEHCPNCRNILSNTIDQSKDLHPSIFILFGAGASHGSAKHDTPPLGAQFFKHLVEFNPKHWGSIPQKSKTSFKMILKKE